MPAYIRYNSSPLSERSSQSLLETSDHAASRPRGSAFSVEVSTSSDVERQISLE